MDKVEQIKNEINKLIIPESKCSNISLMDNGRQYAYREVMEIIESLQDDTETDFGKKPVTKQSVEDVIAEIKEKSKAFTSLEQSKVLAKILPIESADMCWEVIYASLKDDIIEYADKSTIGYIEHCLPAWSLAALLEQLPYELCDDDGNSVYLQVNKEDDVYQLVYEDTHRDFESIETDRYEHFVDACYEMILKLNKLNLL